MNLMGNPFDSTPQFRGSAPLLGDGDVGAIMRRHQPQPMPAPQPAARPPQPAGRAIGYGPAALTQVSNSGEARTGLSLKSVVTAGNLSITAFDPTQLVAQHTFVCVAVLATFNWANDPAATNDARVWADWTQQPQLGGQIRNDGNFALIPTKSKLITLNEPLKVDSSTTLSPGTVFLRGGTAAMNWQVLFEYLTIFDFNRLLISR